MLADRQADFKGKVELEEVDRLFVSAGGKRVIVYELKKEEKKNR